MRRIIYLEQSTFHDFLFFNNLNLIIMKKIMKFLFMLLILFAFSCSQEATLDPLPADLEGVSAKAKMSSDVYAIVLPSGPDVIVYGATATINRNKNGVTVNVKTSGLTPGDAYTLWVVAFNEPGECDDGCNGPDLGPAKGDVMYGTGHVVGGNGKANFSAHISVGDVGDFETGIIDPLTAEIHIVVRTHGEAIPGMIDEQIHTFLGGGCTFQSETDACVDEQFAIFPPPTS